MEQAMRGGVFLFGVTQLITRVGVLSVSMTVL
jgi:hypothetical protein